VHRTCKRRDLLPRCLDRHHTPQPIDFVAIDHGALKPGLAKQTNTLRGPVEFMEGFLRHPQKLPTDFAEEEVVTPVGDDNLAMGLQNALHFVERFARPVEIVKSAARDDDVELFGSEGQLFGPAGDELYVLWKPSASHDEHRRRRIDPDRLDQWKSRKYRL
jgi:hypothetical protein